MSQYAWENRIGASVFIECPISNASDSKWLGELVGIDAHNIYLRRAVRIVDTGRYSAFFRGEYDEHTEWEPLHPDAILSLPRWFARIAEWLQPIPTEPR
jgi:hypothetical protein